MFYSAHTALYLWIWEMSKRVFRPCHLIQTMSTIRKKEYYWDGGNQTLAILHII